MDYVNLEAQLRNGKKIRLQFLDRIFTEYDLKKIRGYYATNWDICFRHLHFCEDFLHRLKKNFRSFNAGVSHSFSTVFEFFIPVWWYAFLCFLLESTKLSEEAKSAVLDEENEICISTLTSWKISLKLSIDKLKLSNVASEELPWFWIWNISFEESAASSFYLLSKVEHFDPFDRLPIWQEIKG